MATSGGKAGKGAASGLHCCPVCKHEAQIYMSPCNHLACLPCWQVGRPEPPIHSSSPESFLGLDACAFHSLQPQRWISESGKCIYRCCSLTTSDLKKVIKPAAASGGAAAKPSG